MENKIASIAIEQTNEKGDTTYLTHNFHTYPAKFIPQIPRSIINALTKECDCVVTNPPYSKKDAFLKKCYSLKKPFALLMPLSSLEGKTRGFLYRENGLQLIIPNKRINFITPSGKGQGAWFQTAWFTWGLNLPKDLLFVDATFGKQKVLSECGDKNEKSDN